jgi:RNA polymerase sigma-70 factor (ECF subfamily)
MTENADSESEVFCVLRAQSGSSEALDQLFKLLQEPLFRYLRTLVRDRSQAEDVLQEVFLRIYRKLKWLREPAALRPWAYQIATREAFRYLKRQSRLREEQDDESAGAPILEQAGSVFPKEMIEELPELINRLSPASRAVIALYYLHELSLNETAAVLEIPVGTVKSRLSYGLAALRREFEKGR